ncbi:uncharacterized protein LOC117609273 isoform X1 [Osmia lignaria lignaria]|uniref:uncharacterized protein LOC117609273 isoform X1 n=1 Tax=Osmia lignaria lignaria TaxID=1437193 RepID=UPI00402B1984
MSQRKMLSKRCCFCGLSDEDELKFGKIYEHADIITHYYCLLLSSNMEQRGDDNEGILGFLIADIQKELRRGKRLTCTYCKKSGATLGCCNVKCKRIFHYPCGLNAGTLNQFFGEFRSFCINHRPKQKIDSEMKKELTISSKVMCYICYDQVNPYSITDTIWAPCCNKNAWFHRKCVQQLAMSAGYFFKCPLCNDKKSFQKAMLQFGIFIPSQDASWELVPNAFEELLYRYDQCDAPICHCPKGRKHTSFNAKWELILCRTCGSQGIHMACGQLKWANPIWECTECISILGKSKKKISSNVTESILQNNSDLEDSDSDISVGKDSPVSFISTPIPDSTPCVSTIKQRPGPRTFKLRQLKASKELQNLQLGSSSKQEIDKEVDPVLELESINECSLQSTSTEESSIIETKSLSVSETKSSINSSSEYFKPQSPALDDTDIILDSDDDTTQITSCGSLESTCRIATVNETEKDGLLQIRNNITEYEGSNALHNSTSPIIKKLLQTNNFKPNNASSFLTNNVNDNSVKYNSQYVVQSDDFEETIELNKKFEKSCPGFFSNIKITNVVSLAPEEFEIVSSGINQQKINNIEYQNKMFDINLKRKFDKTTLDPLNFLIDEPKKIKTNNSIYEQKLKSSYVSVNVKNTGNNVHNVSTSTSDENYSQINNNNEKCTSTNTSNLQSLRSCTQLEQCCSKNENLLPKYRANIKHLFEANTLKGTSNGQISTLSEDVNKSDQTDDNIKNCDGDAGTSSAAKSRSGSLTSDTKINCTSEFIKSGGLYSESERSRTSEQWKSRSNIKKTTISTNKTSNIQKDKNTGCDYSRLIPEYLRLCDLKFRVYNSNNLQMILYNKFSININIENTATVEKNTRFEPSAQTGVQQKFSEIQNEISLNSKSENILHNISFLCNKDKSKCMLSNEQSKTYHDDTKENMNPVITVPCKNITDSLLSNANLATHNLTVSINSSNQNDDRDTTQCIHNAPKVIEENNKESSEENDNLINDFDNIFDAFTNSNNKYVKSINNVTRSIQNLTSSCVKSAITKKNNYFYNSTKLVRHALFPENRTNCKPENKAKSISAAQFKVSIDLKKVEKFIDNNPNLFSKYKKENEQCFKEQNSITERINLLNM